MSSRCFLPAERSCPPYLCINFLPAKETYSGSCQFKTAHIYLEISGTKSATYGPLFHKHFIQTSQIQEEIQLNFQRALQLYRGFCSKLWSLSAYL